MKHLVFLIGEAGWRAIVVETASGDHLVIARADGVQECDLVDDTRKWRQEHGFQFVFKRSGQRISTPLENVFVFPDGRRVEIAATFTVASGFTHWGLSGSGDDSCRVLASVDSLPGKNVVGSDQSTSQLRPVMIAKGSGRRWQDRIQLVGAEPVPSNAGDDRHCYTQAVNEQETVDRFAVLAEPRLTSLLRLRGVRHVYEPTSGALNSRVVEDGNELTLDKLKRASQPYRDIQRFLSDEKVMQYIIGPGLLPVVTALSKDIAGKKLLVTRRVAARDDDKGVVGHIGGFGIRIMMYFDEAAGETIVEWNCLYGVG